MSKIKNINEFSMEQLQEFLMSFDIVMSDIDGVLSHNNMLIGGTCEALKKLEKLGKQVHLITNNNISNDKEFSKLFNFLPEQIINPMKVIIWYLKKINFDFNNEVVGIVSDAAWSDLTEAGLRLIKPEVSFNDPMNKILKQVLDRPSVKAVIIDFDFHCNWSKIALSISCLQREDVLYISGATDEWIIIKSGNSLHRIVGCAPLIDLITRQSGRDPIVCGKPSEALKDYVLNVCNVTDPRRCLFIGDSLNSDMNFALMCGFIKLLVGTGIDTLENAQKKENIQPDYYISSLNQLFAAYKEQTS
ncbi:hypothetical protein HN011_002297 [Eciton burchellii]|nr:hypothetical protein HN011_002297 [Eciton burchellii]